MKDMTKAAEKRKGAKKLLKITFLNWALKGSQMRIMVQTRLSKGSRKAKKPEEMGFGSTYKMAMAENKLLFVKL